MKDRSLAVAIVGGGIVAQQIGESLVERAFPFSSLRFYGGEELRGNQVEVADQMYTIQALEERAGDLDLVFLTRESPWSEREVESMILAGASIVDCSGRYARETDVPLVVPECNGEAIASARERQIVASPDSVAIALSVILAPLDAQAGVRRVVATSIEPVSEEGAIGVEELSRQTLDLLQGRSTESQVFPARVCFNILPRVGEIGPSGDSLAEEQSVWQIRRILEQPDLAIALSRVYAPVFYGTGIAVNIELQTPIDAAEASELLRTAPGLLVTVPEEEVDLSVGDAVGQDATIVSRVRDDHSAENAFNLWISMDNARKGVGVNAVQIAELMLRTG
jgi:aspartate-semialdehyde dehydrogenase